MSDSLILTEFKLISSIKRLAAGRLKVSFLQEQQNWSSNMRTSGSTGVEAVGEATAGVKVKVTLGTTGEVEVKVKVSLIGREEVGAGVDVIVGAASV